MARKAKRKGSSKAGRPRKDGNRYPSGKLKPPGPNDTVIAKRKAGDASAGEHPLDFALSQQWITERQHKDGMAYRAAFSLSHIGGPRLSSGSLKEAPEHEQLRINWSQMSDEAITEIFDRVFSGDIAVEDRPRLEAQALGRWKLLNAHLAAAEREQLFNVAVLGSWPFWMTKRASDRVLGCQDVDRMNALLCGLTGVAHALRPRRTRQATITSAPFKMTRQGRTEIGVNYVTTDGDAVTPTSERGVPFAAATLVRRRA